MSTCMMCTSLYVKANGDVPCWDDVGESHILTRLDPIAPRAGGEPLFHAPALRKLREAHREGRHPFPGLCDRCGVLGHGELPATSTPTSMQVLHLEASYLCHLSCPLCIPAHARRGLSAPPYHMTAASLRRLLEQLCAEGVTTVRMIHFEGRGDPLTNPDIHTLIELGKTFFPSAVSMVTTHASYPPRPRLATCGLDVLRASIDGAFPDSYARYRVGGVLDKALTFLRNLRDERVRTGSPLRVIWKYILFEWNDSDPELRQAALLAEGLQSELRFCLTHSPGRSTRFSDATQLQRHLRDLQIAASVEQTYQLSPGGTPNAAVIEGTAAEHVERFLKAALSHAAANETQLAVKELARALSYDPGLPSVEDRGTATIRPHLETILTRARFALTLSWLAAICRVWGDSAGSSALLRRYLEILPDASDRDHVRQHLLDVAVGEASGRGSGDWSAPKRVEAAFEAALTHAGANDSARAVEEIARGLAVDPGLRRVEDHGTETIRKHLDVVLADARFPLTLSWLAALCRTWGDGEGSIILLRRYLELAPAAPDRDHVERCLLDAVAEQVEAHLKRASALVQAGETGGAVEALRRALAHDPGLPDVIDRGEQTIRAYLQPILVDARFPVTLSWLAALSRGWADSEASAHLLRRYLVLAPRARDRRHVRRHLAAQKRLPRGVFASLAGLVAWLRGRDSTGALSRR